MDIESFKKLTTSILPEKTQGKPHKTLALLSIIEGIDTGEYKENKFYFDSNFKTLFSKWFVRFARTDDRDRPLAPFFHLRSTSFWNLMPTQRKEEELIETSTVGSSGHLFKLVEYAYLDGEIFHFFQEKENREEIKRYLIEHLSANVDKKTSGDESHTEETTPVEIKRDEPRSIALQSKFLHEQQAIEAIIKSLGNQVEFVPNYFLHDPSTNQYLECDLVVVSLDRLSIIELKHWFGEIEIRPYKWIVNKHHHREDPHKSNKYKCQVLRSFYEKAFPTFPKLWVESIVVLTNPDSDVHGGYSYKTEDNNPTFANIETLIKHYRYRTGKRELKKLDTGQVKKVADKLRQQSETQPRKGFHLPGYEIIENLTQTPDKIELIVRPSGNQLQKNQRLRVFLSDPLTATEIRHEQRIKSFNSLKAIEKVGDHPNILRVWNIPHEDGLIIEASDWSQEGTLADVIQKQKEFSVENAISIIRGILNGLSVIHKEDVIHRDLRPSNILMVRGIPKLMNFDLSYLLEDKRLTVFPQADSLKPSPYMAPELYHAPDVSETADLFSVGVIFYELLCRHLPFKDSADLEKNSGVLSDSALDELKNCYVSELLQIIIYSLIQQDQHQRPQTAEEVLKDLEQCITTEEEKAIPVTNRILEPGETHGVYQIEELIGKGREAQVYRAKQTTEREVALKLFHHEVLRERIYAERDAMDSVRSPYIAHCQAPGQWSDNRLFLVLNLIKGTCLRKVIEEQKQPDLEEFKHVTLCLLEALKTMHGTQDREEPLLHNDIKPENIVLTLEKYPVIIDFGTASPPHTDAYMGTPPYTAPDLVQGVDFEYCESGDIFALGVTLFEYLFAVKPYEALPSISANPVNPRDLISDLPQPLEDWLLKSVRPLKADRFHDVQEMKTAFEKIFDQEHPDDKKKAEERIKRDPQHKPSEDLPCGNEFVAYLNTLHNTTPGNENALAESQALNPYFGSIHVSLDLTDFIAEQLISSDGSHVILTGHAGDGKSTIALELYKRFKNIPMHIRLPQALSVKEEISADEGITLHIVKDMSELPEKDQINMFLEASSEDLSENRWLIISNTGTLLETLRAVAHHKEINEQELENHLLSLLQKKEPEYLNDFSAPFQVINLTQIDNVHIAMQLFEKLIHEDNWEVCDTCDLRKTCPIHINVTALQEFRPIASERIKWIYRHLYEYGNRLTMRQITAHLSYALTAGLDYETLCSHAAMPIPPDISDYLFHNRFFGFKGVAKDDEGRQLTALEQIMPLELGSKPYPTLDRRLWTIETGLLPELPASLENLFESGLRIEYGANSDSSRYRQQIRRMFYIFGKVSGDLQNFPTSFSGSQMLTESETWQKVPDKLSLLRKDDLMRKVLHVLQEQFTGFHLPENMNTSELYITLNRKNEDLRQSVQILLKRIPFSNFTLYLKPVYQTFKPQRYVLTLEETFSKIKLHLALPFLDFIMMRHTGEVGQPLDTAYSDRLERFKARLLQSYKSEYLELLELKNNGELETRRFVVNENTLEVV